MTALAGPGWAQGRAWANNLMVLMVKFQLLGLCPGIAWSARGDLAKHSCTVSKTGWNTDKKQYPIKFKSLSVVMIPFLILWVLFLFFLCFPDSLISTEVFHLPKQKVELVVISTPSCFIPYHGSVAVANKWWCFQYSRECCGKSLNQMSDGKWGRKRKMLRLK